MAESHEIWVRVFFADTNRRGLMGTLDLSVLLTSELLMITVDDVVAYLSKNREEVAGIENYDYQAFVTSNVRGVAELAEANLTLTGRTTRYTSLKIISKMGDPVPVAKKKD